MSKYEELEKLGVQVKLAAPSSNGHTPPVLNRSFILMCLGQDEAGDAQLLAKLYDGELVYDHADKTWYTFGPHAWTKINGIPWSKVWARVATVYVELSAVIHGEIENEPDEEEKKKKIGQYEALKSRAKKLRARQRISNVLQLAQELLGISGDEWGADQWVIGVNNGVVDLRTGQLRDGRPTDYIRSTMASPSAWAGLDAPCDRWKQFLHEVLSGETDRIDFVQRVLGYGLNGVTKENLLVVCWGPQGRNGKKELFAAVKHAAGGYVGTVHPDVLVGSDHLRTKGSAQEYLMDLQGKRIAVCSETEKEVKLSVALVKYVTGDDPINARRNFGHQVTFAPTHTLFLQTNDKPHAPPDDDALWERVKLLEFKERFVEFPEAPNEHPRDPALADTLKAEAPGILAWLVRGGIEWQTSGLQTPLSVQHARDAYRLAESLDPFLAACCVLGAGYQARTAELHSAYTKWCETSGVKAQNLVWFGRELKKRFPTGEMIVGGFKRACYDGIGLRSTWGDDTDTNPCSSIPEPNTGSEDENLQGLGAISKSSMENSLMIENSWKTPVTPVTLVEVNITPNPNGSDPAFRRTYPVHFAPVGQDRWTLAAPLDDGESID